MTNADHNHTPEKILHTFLTRKRMVTLSGTFTGSTPTHTNTHTDTHTQFSLDFPVQFQLPIPSVFE